MKKPTRGIFEMLPFLLVAGVAVFPSSIAQAEPASDPAGFYRITCLGNSDTVVSIPFTRPEAASALVESINGNVVTVKGTPGWVADQFVYAPVTQSNTYYLRLLSSDKEGRYYPIVANGDNNLTLDLSDDDISSVTNGTRLAIIPYWTLATAFPDGRGVIASTSQLFNRRTEILIPNFNGVGINLSASTTFYYYKPVGSPTGNWYQQGDLLATKNDAVLLPDVYFIVRHNNSVDGTVFTAQGCVPVSKLAVPLVSQPATAQDNFVALARPATVTLNASGLLEGGFVTNATLNPAAGDQLLVFNNALVAKNKSAAASYNYRSGAWRKVGDLLGDWGNEPVLQPGTGVIIRKKSENSGGVSSFWINTPTY